MLHADKAALLNQLEVELIEIRQKELNHYTHCCLTLSAPAALIAGFAYTALVQVVMPEDVHPVAEALFYASVIGAMVAEVAAVVKVTLVALCAPHLALRGPSGSMHTAVDAMRPAFFQGMQYFWVGLACVHVSGGVVVFLSAQHRLVPFLACAFLLITTAVITYDIRSTIRTFHVPKRSAVDGKFSPEPSGLRSGAATTASSLIRKLEVPQAHRQRTPAQRSPPPAGRMPRLRAALRLGAEEGTQGLLPSGAQEQAQTGVQLQPAGASKAPPGPSALAQPPAAPRPPPRAQAQSHGLATSAGPMGGHWRGQAAGSVGAGHGVTQATPGTHMAGGGGGSQLQPSGCTVATPTRCTGHGARLEGGAAASTPPRHDAPGAAAAHANEQCRDRPRSASPPASRRSAASRFGLFSAATTLEGL